MKRAAANTCKERDCSNTKPPEKAYRLIRRPDGLILSSLPGKIKEEFCIVKLSCYYRGLHGGRRDL